MKILVQHSIGYPSMNLILTLSENEKKKNP